MGRKHGAMAHLYTGGPLWIVRYLGEASPVTGAVDIEGLTTMRPRMHGLHERDCRECERTECHGCKHHPVPAQASRQC